MNWHAEEPVLRFMEMAAAIMAPCANCGGDGHDAKEFVDLFEKLLLDEKVTDQQAWESLHQAKAAIQRQQVTPAATQPAASQPLTTQSPEGSAKGETTSEGAIVRSKKAEELTNALIAAAIAGDYEKALTIAEKAMAISPQEPIAVYNVACMLARLGHTDKALDHLERAVKLGFPEALKQQIEGDQDLESLRQHPRYKALIAELRKNAEPDVGEASTPTPQPATTSAPTPQPASVHPTASQPSSTMKGHP
jgi:tetratricopeptide (TPR) repeat protein